MQARCLRYIMQARCLRYIMQARCLRYIMQARYLRYLVQARCLRYIPAPTLHYCLTLKEVNMKVIRMFAVFIILGSSMAAFGASDLTSPIVVSPWGWRYRYKKVAHWTF